MEINIDVDIFQNQEEGSLLIKVPYSVGVEMVDLMNDNIVRAVLIKILLNLAVNNEELAKRVPIPFR